jgi:hypothetical protein
LHPLVALETPIPLPQSSGYGGFIKQGAKAREKVDVSRVVSEEPTLALDIPFGFLLIVYYTQKYIYFSFQLSNIHSTLAGLLNLCSGPLLLTDNRQELIKGQRQAALIIFHCPACRARNIING